MGAFESLLPDAVKQISHLSGTEWAIPFPAILDVIDVASAHSIAILGVEEFLLVASGLQCAGLSGYEFYVDGPWEEFVKKNNQAASDYFHGRAFTAETRFILSTTSLDEFRELVKED